MARKNRAWSAADHDFVVKNYGFLSFGQIAGRLDRTPAAVARRYYGSEEAAGLGLQTLPRLVPSALGLAEHDALLRHYQARKNDREMGEAVGRSAFQVRRWRAYHGLPAWPCGEVPGWMERRRELNEEICRGRGVDSIGQVAHQSALLRSLHNGCAVPMTGAEERVARFVRGAGPVTAGEIGLALGYRVRSGADYHECFLRRVLGRLRKKGVLSRGWRKTGPGRNDRTPLYATVPGSFTDEPEFLSRRQRDTDWASMSDEQLALATRGR